MKKNQCFGRMIRGIILALALFAGTGSIWCTPVGMLAVYAKGMEKPTLNAAVSDGMLSIQAESTTSAVQKIVVNGYEFDDIWNGTLHIRLQQFDASYPEFTIQAADQDENWSEVYKVPNPYYKDPDQKEEGTGESKIELPVSAVPTDPGSATARITEYENNGQGKEFYTIQTASEKTFYLIVDRNGENENVYFLTEISENDLLNTTSGNSETLPKNSAALESAIPTAEKASPDYSVNEEETEESNQDEESVETVAEEIAEKTEQPLIGYLVIGAVALVVIGAGYYLKVVRKKKEDFLDEDEEDEEEVYEEEPEESEDDFFSEEDMEITDDMGEEPEEEDE